MVSDIAFYSTIFSSSLLVWVFLGMTFSYTNKRAGQRYALNKKAAPTINSFAVLSKVLFVFSMIFTLLSYWLSFLPLLSWHDSHFLQLLGSWFVLLGYWGLNYAFRELGENYSPLFDAYTPHQIIRSGVYRHIRHPIYAFNLFVSFGLAISSGSILVLCSALIGLHFILRAMTMEETHLQQEFAEYSSYCQKSYRLIPFIY